MRGMNQDGDGSATRFAAPWRSRMTIPKGRLPLKRYIQASRRFMTPVLLIFVALQSLDVLTTLIGLRVGAVESSSFIGELMARFGAVTGLLLSKTIAAIIVVGAIFGGRSRLILFANCWFTGIVSWNVLIIGASIAARS